MTRDRAVGLTLAITGAAVGVAAAQYERGPLRNIGPGFFPILIASVLATLGLLVATRRPADRVEGAPAVRSMLQATAVPIAIVACALLVERAGILLAAMALVIISSCARAGGRWRDAALLALVLSLLATAIFVWALGVPLPVLPPPIGWP